MLRVIGLDHPHLTVDEAEMASIRNGRSQYWSAISPYISAKHENINIKGTRQNYGHYGGTVDLYKNIIIDIFETGFVDTVLYNLYNNM